MIRPPGLWTPKSLYSYNPIPRGCVLYLPLWAKDLSGAIFKSVDAYGHTGTVTGAVWQPDGRLFNATDDVIAVSIGAELTHGTADWTWSFWVDKAAHLTNDHIFLKPTSFMRVRTNGVAGALAIHFEGEATITTNDALYDEGTPTFITIQRSGNDCVIRKNGAAFQTIANSLTTGNQTTADTVINVGNYANANGLLGTIGDFWMWARLLSASEDTHNYNCTKWRYQ